MLEQVENYKKAVEFYKVKVLHAGFDMKFGLFSVDFETQERSLRNGSKTYIDIVKNNN